MKNELDPVRVRHYTNEKLGIYDFQCSPKMIFYEEEDIKRVALNWKECWDNGKLGWWIGEMGIIVVAYDVPIGGSALVAWDDGGVSGIHKNKITIVRHDHETS
jgi:hypothetical protein